MKRVLSGLALVYALCAATVAMPGPAAAAAPQQAAASEVAAPIPYKKEESGAGDAAAKSILVLAALLGLAWGGLTLARRKLPRSPIAQRLGLGGGAERRLKLVESMRLGPKASLYLVQLDQRTLLLAQSGERIIVAASDSEPGAIDKKDIEVATHS